MSYQYSQEAKERVRKLGQSDIIDFIGEVPITLRRKVFSLMPKIPGFRVGQPLEIQEKQKRLIGYMFQTHSAPEEIYAWKSFALVWKLWAEEKIGKPFTICEEKGVEPGTGLIFIKELADTFPKASREDVERLYSFSGFTNDSKITAAFEFFRPARILARDNALDALPIRLDELEERIELAKYIIEDNESSIKSLKSATNSLATELKKYAKDNKLILKSLIDLKDIIEKEVKRTDKVNKVVDDLSISKKDIYLNLENITIKNNTYDSAIDEFYEYGKNLDCINKKIVEMQNSLEGIYEKESNDDVLNHNENYKLLAERIDILDSNFEKKSSGLIYSQCNEIHENKTIESVEHVSTHDEAFNIISSNLQAVGLNKESSKDVARLVLAAFISGQIVQLCGSLADIVADAIASAVGAPLYHEWRVPVGLISDATAFDFVQSAANSSHCLVLKGANLSAFEIYGTAIRDIVVQRQIYQTDYDHLALIATWKQGHAVFPDGGMLAELGPVIDTDTLKLRGVSVILPKLKLGVFSKRQWSEIEGMQSDVTREDISELRELLEESGFDGGNLWKRMISRFYISLMSIPDGNSTYDLYSVLFYYTLPWARVKNGPVEKIASIAERELTERGEQLSA